LPASSTEEKSVVWMHCGASVQWAANSAKCVVWTWKFGVLGQGFRVVGLG